MRARLIRPVDGRTRLHLGPVAPRVGNLIAGVSLAIACLAVALVSLIHARTGVQATDLLAALLGRDADPAALDILDLRAPRVVLALVTGFIVAVAGAILQTLARNPLAEPGLLGLSQGAVVATMLLAALVPAATLAQQSLAATGGALLTGVTILALVGPGRAAGLSILLMGIAVQTVLASVSALLLVHAPPDLSYRLAAWSMGALDRASWPLILGYLPWAFLTVPLLILAGPSLRAYDLGEDLARALGEPLGMRRVAILLAVVALTGASTAAAGPLLFLGVMAPHLATYLSPASGTARLVLSGLVGALLVALADLAARLAMPVLPLPLGLCLVLIGVPAFAASLRLAGSRP
ncbi:FecCD family ABC transporter permease [Paracoccus sp. NSM]|uniref:FecCD family ABC transporter permease n=1 Tax=Paracoccus sp. NSM TaxID=3457784 RepID=UPI004036F5C7